VQLPLGEGNAGEDDNKTAVLARIGKRLGIGINGVSADGRYLIGSASLVPSATSRTGPLGNPFSPFGHDLLQLIQDA